jgi:hypothetical protein
MEVFPSARVCRFEQVQPGDLFVYLGQQNSYAIKTEKPINGDRSKVVMLGPKFPYEADEALILPWQAATVISYGRDFFVSLPTDPGAWFESGSTREPVCLALHEGKAFVCANGGPSPRHFFQCYVELGSGKVIEDRFSGAAYTNRWEIIVPHSKLPFHTLLKFPPQKSALT